MNQNILTPKLSIADAIRGLLLALLVVIGTFPENDWSYSVGIDPPLFWVFNHLFETGLNIGRHIIFPHGPLAFFMYPLTENILIATMVTSLLKGLLVFNVVFLFNDTKNQTKWLAAFAFAYLISLIAHFNHLILANIILLYCNYQFSNFKPYKFLALLLTAFAFYVKAYVAIVAGTLFFSFLVYTFIQQRNIKNTLVDAFSLLCFIVMLWLVMFGTLRGFLSFVWGMVNLAQDNSSAAAYYPQNNWLILIFFIAILVSIFVINRNKKARFFGALIALSLFASWKHAMAREDFYHTKGFLVYLVICLFAFILINRKNYLTNLILAVIVLFLFNANQTNVENYFSQKYELFRVNNFIEFAGNFNALKEKSLKNSERKTVINKLPQSILEKIGDSKVDVYPWDYSIAGVNKLNWQPRVVIQSYAAYTSWLDEQNAQHFTSENAPEYLIWEMNKATRDVNGCDFNSLDNRYILNDEPKTILQLISNYGHCISEGKFILFKKREKPVSFETNTINSVESSWGEWIETPDFNLELLRAKLNFNKNIGQGLKSFFYKDEQFWMYLKLKNGSINKYRIVPKNAADGLWINPYIFNGNNILEVEQIMFKASNQKILTPEITIEWEEIGFENKPNQIASFFNFDYNTSNSLLFSATKDYELPTTKFWNNINANCISDNSFKGEKAQSLKGTNYSSTFRFPLDSIPFGQLRVTSDAWINAPNYKPFENVSLVISVEDKNGGFIYERTTIDEQLIDRKEWNNIFKFIEFDHEKANCDLVIYLWSTENQEIYIDDFRVQIYGKN